MLTIPHCKESLSRAYVTAVVGRARHNLLWNREYDYGVDGSVRILEKRGNRIRETGLGFDFQSKTTTDWWIDGADVVYDLEANAYNDLVERAGSGALPFLLILFCLPKDDSTWLDVSVDKLGLKLSSAELKVLLREVSWRVETAPAVIVKSYKPGKKDADPLRGLYEVEIGGKQCVVEYELDSDLRDTEQVPLLEPGGVEAFIDREVLPYTPDAWIDESATKVGFEVSFTRHFYKPQPLRTPAEIRDDIVALEKETEGLVGEIVKGGTQ